VSIHSTAIIHPQAQLGSNIVVGPYAVIEGPAVIGDGSRIAAHAVISGHVVMGKNNEIGYGAIIGAEPQDLSFKSTVQSRVIIGDDNRIREYATIHRGSKDGSDTVVGNHCFLMAGAHLAHDVRLGSHVIIANNALLAGHVHVGDRVFIGGGCVFHQFMRIGSYAICQGLSGFGKDIPPYVIAAQINGVAGLNVIGLRRNGFDSEQRLEIKRAFNLLYRSGRNTSQAQEMAATLSWSEAGKRFWDFIASAKKRGICDWLGARKNAPKENDV
jgi:UDP-N-acetylglucosamine acyltransferase